MGFLPSIIILGLLALFAWRLAVSRAVTVADERARKAAAVMLLAATLVQAVHFAEETMTGFHSAFPAMLGLPPISFPVFIAFNLVWLILWFASVPGVFAGHKFAMFAGWFLAVAGMLNGVAHPLLAAVAGGYFPGLVTSPLIGIAGLLLWQRLHRATLAPEPAGTA